MTPTQLQAEARDKAIRELVAAAQNMLVCECSTSTTIRQRASERLLAALDACRLAGVEQ